MVNEELDEHALKYCRIMSMAFIEIRAAVELEEYKKIYTLASFFHNTPIQVARILQNGDGYEKVLDWLYQEADQKGLSAWLKSISE